ncbi:type II toxin-antitoxin system VapC family toxin [Cellulomonas shaoxiangyii]|uniref:Type II toxin-antitoxin system VapC family toxin n=1 Tax=Cellulomonas shaoxiangyii TaxID=2566013 RepID=A0A4P7SI56_9CELL|nr:type II toxin-antitoxin system VapC family toxin [Cellulomonas shaoxiangyii]QCB92324.1 type II toxin-antitoxin system VapC family toxin [Cellulomonas shaoxiangyii]TGY86282.1 type II toxin-antitoxin system VapC family toxin [Cellulomonas shaoxiangyii]
MKVLLDTHVLLWWLADDPRLSARHRDVVADGRNDVYYSAVSIAEMAIKTSLGKLEAPAGVPAALEAQGMTPLPFTAAHAERLRDLPWHHRDPFDRMLVAQGQVEGLMVATVDARIRAYDVPTL